MIKRVWAKFTGMSIECICDERAHKCGADDACKEYVVKFMEIDRRDEGVKDAVKRLEKETSNLGQTMKKFESQINKSIKKFKI